MAGLTESYSEDGFHRQRRNLLVGCTALLFVQLADVHLVRQGSVLGLPVSIGKPDLVEWFLFFGVIYWAIRYYQYHRQRHPSEMAGAARTAMVDYLRPHAISCIHPKTPNYVPPAVNEGQRAVLVPHDFSIAPYRRRFLAGQVKPAWMIYEGEVMKELKDNEQRHPVIFKGWLMWKARIRAYLLAAIHTPGFTEYFLPYLAFAVCIGVSLHKFAR